MTQPADAYLSLTGAFRTEELKQLIDSIEQSGELGRSQVYVDLLRYLVDCALQNKSPKEIEIAIDVMGRDADFDVSKDSAVRVYVHQLRKKLDRYYSKHARQAAYRIVIPKGQYTVAALRQGSEHPLAGRLQGASRAWWGGWALATVLLVSNLAYFATRDLWAQASPEPAAETPVWQPLLADETPVMVVMGDYYIFGELDEAGNVYRMVREFSINSKEDLETLFAGQPELAGQYYDLDLTYMPEGSAFALNSVLPVIHSSGKPVTMKMMSELTTQDIQSHHIVYVGYISALDRLQQLYFAASGLDIGDNYDELVNKSSGEAYVSDAGLPAPNRSFTDYGLLARFSVSANNQVLLVTGMRDAGLIHSAKVAAEREALQQVRTALDGASAFEALYRVKGVDRQNFTSRRVYTQPINSRKIWDRKEGE